MDLGKTQKERNKEETPHWYPIMIQEKPFIAVYDGLNMQRHIQHDDIYEQTDILGYMKHQIIKCLKGPTNAETICVACYI